MRAETVCQAAEGAEEAHRKRVEALAQDEALLPVLRQAANEAQTELVAWQGAWAQAVVGLGLPEHASLQRAEAALSAWARIAETAPAWRSTGRRIAEMSTVIASFIKDVETLQVRLTEPASSESALAVVESMSRRLAAARTTESNKDSLTKRITAHMAEAADAERRLRDAEQELATLRDAAKAVDDSELERIIAQLRQRDDASKQVSDLEPKLRAQGDGLTESALRAEAAEIDPDAAAGRLAEIAADLAELGERRERLSEERTRSEHILVELRKGRDAAAKAQEAEDALADAAAAAERYARLHVARVLLRSGIDRFRQQQQGPLLRAAGTHFALLTGGRYGRLGVDEDADGRTVLHAVRDDGRECPVEALSEGTRDQLYLALRVAAVERHAAQAEALPFVADDLLVQFDDARTKAAIALLARLGRATQVILFTHHNHIAALAAQNPDVALHGLAAP